MRLQCPNCDAEYEVGASAIPFDGRDVQCSNCGHGWFQAHPDFEVDYAIESALYDPPPPLAQGEETPIPRRELDPEALRVLREEVALEEAKRAEDAARATAAAVVKPTPQADGPEAVLDAMVAKDARDVRLGAQSNAQPNAQPRGQTDIYRSNPDRDADLRDIEAELDADQIAQAQNANAGAPLPRVLPRRVARLKGSQDDAVTQNAPMSGAIEAAPPQTAPMKPQPNAGAAQAQDFLGDFAPAIPAPPKKSGSRAGFYVVLMGALLAVAGYVFGPDLANSVPDLAAPVGQYITFVNSLRDQVQVIVPQALAMAKEVPEMAKGAVQFVLDWFAAQGWI